MPTIIVHLSIDIVTMLSGSHKGLSHFEQSRTPPNYGIYISKKRKQRQHKETKCVGESGQMLKIIRYFYYHLIFLLIYVRMYQYEEIVVYSEVKSRRLCVQKESYRIASRRIASRRSL